MFKTNVWGRIIAGTHTGWFIRVEQHNDGSYTILISDEQASKNSTDGADYFASNKDSVMSQIEYEGWEIEWLE